MNNKKLFKLCEQIALNSPDSSRKIGCIILNSEDNILSFGWNDFPFNVDVNEQRLSKENGEKYHWMCHAEEKTILSCLRSGKDLYHSKIYTTLFPCSSCARLIIESGIKEVNTFEIPENDKTYSRSFEVSQIMFNEVGIKVNIFNREDILNG
jgi:dCMP deaminase